VNDHAATEPVKVTISNPLTGAVLEEKIVSNDYMLITAGTCFLKAVQVWGSGAAHILRVRTRPEKSR
jgi:hypothetical protein